MFEDLAFRGTARYISKVRFANNRKATWLKAFTQSNKISFNIRIHKVTGQNFTVNYKFSALTVQ